MASYAEGLNICTTPMPANRKRTTDAETTPLRNPEITNMISTWPMWPKSGGAAASWPRGCST